MLHLRVFMLLLLIAAEICIIQSENSGDAVDLSVSCIRKTQPKILEAIGVQSAHAPIILMHGMMGDKHTWSGVQKVLAMLTERQVCALDARNHGDSPKTNKFTLDLLVADALKLMDRLNFTKSILIGHSMGGKTAMVVALKHPERVEKLIVEDMSPQASNPQVISGMKFLIQLLLQSLDSIPEGADEEIAAEAVYKYIKNKLEPFGYGHMADELKPQLEKFLKCTEGKCQFKMDLKMVLKALEESGLLEPITGDPYSGPTLFVYGKNSLLKVEEDEVAIRKLFPNLQMVGIEGASHTVHDDKPKEFMTAVIKFLKQS